MAAVFKLFLKTLTFLSFQTYQEISNAMEEIAFLDWLLLWLKINKPKTSLNDDQTQIVKRHLKSRQATNFCTWLQSFQQPQFLYPLFSSLYAFHSWFWVFNQVNILHLEGAQGFQTIEGIMEVV
jgi:hypothetical protein